MFLLNPEGYVHICEYSNSPFSRPDLRILIEGERDVRGQGDTSLGQSVWGSELCPLRLEVEGVAIAPLVKRAHKLVCSVFQGKLNLPCSCPALRILCLQMDVLPVVITLCSPALASSCSYGRAEAAPQTSSAALLPVMSLQEGSNTLVPLCASMHLSNSDQTRDCLWAQS